jgi:uncharacterized protein (TIGR02284 family)
MEIVTENNTIDVLNSLVIINNDRIEGYKTASKEKRETDLKELFFSFIVTSEQCRKELIAEIIKLGGIPNEGTRIIGKFFRVWMEVKAALTGRNRKAILDSCKYGEGIALETYKNVLIQDVHEINSMEQLMLNKHYEFLKTDYDTIMELRSGIIIKRE